MKDKPSSVLCIDRITQKPRILSFYNDILSILYWCVENQIPISICSKSSNYEAAEQILTSFGVWQYFQYPQIYYARKTFHFRNLRSCTNYIYSDFLFFDDEIKNISVCQNIGVQGCLVDKATGLTSKIFLEGLKHYCKNISNHNNNINSFQPSPWKELIENHNISHTPPITPHQKRSRIAHDFSADNDSNQNSFIFPEEYSTVTTTTTTPPQFEHSFEDQNEDITNLMHSQQSSSLILLSTPPPPYQNRGLYHKLSNNHSNSLMSLSNSSSDLSSSSVSPVSSNDGIPKLLSNHPTPLNLSLILSSSSSSSFSSFSSNTTSIITSPHATTLVTGSQLLTSSNQNQLMKQQDSNDWSSNFVNIQY